MLVSFCLGTVVRLKDRRKIARRWPVDEFGVGQRGHLDDPTGHPLRGQLGLLSGECAHDLVRGLGRHGLNEIAHLLGNRGGHRSCSSASPDRAGR
jgi:hypothetical protein